MIRKIKKWFGWFIYMYDPRLDWLEIERLKRRFENEK